MEKIMEKMDKYESWTEKGKIGKWIHMDLSVLVIAAICTQLLAHIWYGNEMGAYRMDSGNLCMQVSKVHVGSAGIPFEKWKNDTVYRAKAAAQPENPELVVMTPAVMGDNAQMEDSFESGREDSAGRMMTPAEEVNESKITYVDNVAAQDEEDKVLHVDARDEENEITEERNTIVNPADAGTMLELEGFLVNEKGMIESCKDPAFVSSDGIIIFPSDERCTGIGQGALDEITEAEEVYIPANIISIETDMLGRLNGLMYIEVAPENPVYESRDGLLYSKEGELLVTPSGRL